jgi:photosystem II stability/assembly factor-like uncharacterized protein
MKKSLLHTISILPRKLIFVLFLFIINYSLLTINCYSQWYKQTVPVNKTITGLKFIDTLRGWACTGGSPYDTSYILHTANGGSNWFIQYISNSPTSLVYYGALYAVDSNIIYAGGFNGATANLTKTTNGGINWTVIPTPTNMGIDDMQFMNKDSGWVCENVGFGPDVRTTTDGGLTWIVRTNGIAAQTQKIFFLNYNTGYCCANHFLYKTTNTGINWNLLYNFPYQVQVYFINENTGWATRAGFDLSFTTNGGLNWIIQNLPSVSQGSAYDLLFFDNLTGYAGVDVDKIFKTTDWGQHWGYQIDSGGSKIISFGDTAHGWTVPIYTGIIDHTTNGGGQITYVGIINISENVPKEFKLYQNYPNPFNPNTNIRFSLVKSSYVQIKIFDVSGRELNPWIFGWYPETLLQAGTHEFQLEGSEMAAGVYFFKLIVTDGAKTSNKIYESTIKMILVK